MLISTSLAEGKKHISKFSRGNYLKVFETARLKTAELSIKQFSDISAWPSVDIKFPPKNGKFFKKVNIKTKIKEPSEYLTCDG